MAKESLQEIRRRIDAVDQRLQELLAERARLAQSVARIKAGGPDDTNGYYRPAREAEVLRAVAARNSGPLSDEAVMRVFREIMSACLALEQPLTVAYLGPQGTYTQAAAIKHFGQSVTTIALASVDEVFREVEAAGAHYGVVPIENSSEGVVTHTLDRFVRSRLSICGEVVLPIHHCLLGAGGSLEQVREVRAHVQSLAQCRDWLDAHLPTVARTAVASNAEGARQAAGETGVAAIAARTTAALYGLEVLAENIEDDPENTTRFLVIGKQKVRATGHDKTSIMVSADNRPGALMRLIAPFSKHGISMTRIESRPSRRSPWDYNFFIDFEGHEEDTRVRAVLDEVEKQARLFRVLGAYPAAVY